MTALRIAGLGTGKPIERLSRLLTHHAFKRVDLKTASKEALKLVDGVSGVFVLTRKAVPTDAGQIHYILIDAGHTDDLLSGISMVATILQKQEPCLVFLVAALADAHKRADLVAQLKAFRSKDD
jgi:hypothetical protein